MTGTTWVAWGSGRVPVGVNTAEGQFNTVEKTGGISSYTAWALIGATNGDTSRIGYHADSKSIAMGGYADDTIVYSYSIAGNSVIGDIRKKDINHVTTVIRENGSNMTTVQPYITCYMWKRTK